MNKESTPDATAEFDAWVVGLPKERVPTRVVLTPDTVLEIAERIRTLLVGKTCEIRCKNPSGTSCIDVVACRHRTIEQVVARRWLNGAIIEIWERSAKWAIQYELDRPAPIVEMDEGYIAVSAFMPGSEYMATWFIEVETPCQKDAQPTQSDSVALAPVLKDARCLYDVCMEWLPDVSDMTPDHPIVAKLDDLGWSVGDVASALEWLRVQAQRVARQEGQGGERGCGPGTGVGDSRM